MGSDRLGVAVVARVDFVLDLRSESLSVRLLCEGFAAAFVAVVAPSHLPTFSALLAGFGGVSVND